MYCTHDLVDLTAIDIPFEQQKVSNDASDLYYQNQAKMKLLSSKLNKYHKL